MSREMDRRDFTTNKVTPTRQDALNTLAADVSEQLPGEHRIRIGGYDAVTGNPSMVVSEAAPAEQGNYIERAMEHMQGIGAVLGLESAEMPEYVPDPNIQKTTSGAVAVHLQQYYRHIPIFQASETVRFAPDGALTETAGSTISISEYYEVEPRTSAQAAVLHAARHVAEPDPDEMDQTDPFGEPLAAASVDLAGWQPVIMAAFTDQPEQPAVFEAGPFAENIKTSLIWFPLGEELRLAWEVILTMPGYQGQYRTLVDAVTGEILYCRQLMSSLVGSSEAPAGPAAASAVSARGSVYLVDGSGPRQSVDFPRAWQSYGLPIPLDLSLPAPDAWVETDSATGNCVFARLGEGGPSIRGRLQEGGLLFDPADPTGDEQKVLNIFFYNCFMHDYFYLLGFREADGNFQQNNFGRGGAPSDRVDAIAHPGPVWGTANMYTPVDGMHPVMNMGLVSSTNRHTAFDSSVVFHEFMHGVTNRLVGGPMNSRALDAPQSGGMGEGWGDYVACTINNATVVGAWVVNRPRGIRAFAYDSSFPDHFGKMGTGRYSEVHNIGELWCAALMELNRAIGAGLAIQLVVDALKLSPANPSFLDMRDAILRALDHKRDARQLTPAEYSGARQEFWRVFSKFGMGPGARSNGASLSGIVADFNPPEETSEEVIRFQVEPNQAIPDRDPAGTSSTIHVPQAARIKRLDVFVDIEHTYIGDLQVSLIPPAGQPVMLHSRSGASADNLVATYTSLNLPALAALNGAEAQGSWTLKVADLARRDTGRLRSWGMELEVEPNTQVLQGEAAPGLTIPDKDPAGVNSAVTLTGAGAVKAVQLDVDITHTYIGDLVVAVLSPNGKSAMLHNRAGGGQDNLIVSYTVENAPALAQFTGDPAQGSWTLMISDLAGRDVGKLNRWSIAVTV
jgi:extracellular elastinolytic metalloproteinase